MMTMEAGGLVEQIRGSNKVGRVDKVISKKNRGRKRVRIQLKRNVQLVSFTLQRLFESCQHVFKGLVSVPSTVDVQSLCAILDDMKPEDVGLKKDLQFFNIKGDVEGTPRVTSATIYKSENFELCIFFLPANAVIPLHNHPDMTVFSKLLLGTMHIKAYDWVHPQDSNYVASNSNSRRLAKLKVNAAFTPESGASVLYPTSGGNIHEFTAITPCAVLDVIGPPYNKDNGSYYKDIPCRNLSVSGEGVMEKVDEDDGSCYGWLEEIEHPEESEMDAIEYMGPQIIHANS